MPTSEAYNVPVFVKCPFCVVEGGDPFLLMEDSYPCKMIGSMPFMNQNNGQANLKMVKEDVYLCLKHYKIRVEKDLSYAKNQDVTTASRFSADPIFGFMSDMPKDRKG